MRLGHVSEKDLFELVKQNLLNGDKIEKLKFCNHCILGKTQRGPTRTMIHGGCSYFLTIIDDYSWRVWIYILKNKKQFNKFCKKLGIKRRKTIIGTPQHNDLAKRMNRTIPERVKCMLLSASLPKTFWGGAVIIAIHLINRCPLSAIGFKIPMKLWNVKPTNYSNLRVFGALAFVHVKQDRLGACAIRYAFIGYPCRIKGYKLGRMKLGEPKCIISKDVVFNETGMAMMSKDQQQANNQENDCIMMRMRSQKCKSSLSMLYVDDILLESSRNDEINRLKSKLNFEFEIKELEKVKRILGMIKGIIILISTRLYEETC
ncbi:hypothetical protein CR513_25348, partial [Mucuna pruriens]